MFCVLHAEERIIEIKIGRWWRRTTVRSVSWRAGRGDRIERIRVRSLDTRTDDLRCAYDSAESTRPTARTSSHTRATDTRTAFHLYTSTPAQISVRCLRHSEEQKEAILIAGMFLRQCSVSREC